MRLLFRKHRSLFFLVSILVVAVLAAVVGALVASRSIDRYAQSIESFLPGEQLTRAQLPRVEGSLEEQLKVVYEQQAGVVLPVVNIRDGVHRSSEVVRSSAIGYATALTTDGWVVVPLDVTRHDRGVLRVVGRDDVHGIVEIQRDDEVRVAFAKTTLVGVPIGSFGASDHVDVGDVLFVLTPSSGAVRSVMQADWIPNEGVVQSSDELNRRLRLDQSIDVQDGALVVDASGALIGLLESEQYVIPFHLLTSALEDVLAGEPITRPELGLTYIDLTRVIDGSLERGLRVTRVERRSFAEEAGLTAGDRILRVNGEEAGLRPLAEHVRTARTGDQLNLVVVHTDGTEEEIFVTL